MHCGFIPSSGFYPRKIDGDHRASSALISGKRNGSERTLVRWSTARCRRAQVVMKSEENDNLRLGLQEEVLEKENAILTSGSEENGVVPAGEGVTVSLRMVDRHGAAIVTRFSPPPAHDDQYSLVCGSVRPVAANLGMLPKFGDGGFVLKQETTQEIVVSDKNAYLDLVVCLLIYGSFPAMFAFLEIEVLASKRDLVMTVLFTLGYFGIILEDVISLNKSAVSMIMATFLWTTLGAVGDRAEVGVQLTEKLGSVSEIVLFLMGAMTIVEIIDSHDGFDLVTNFIRTNSRRSLLWIIGFVTFFMSSILDNLTSTIVMVSLLRKLVKDPEERKLYGGVVVIAANAGGAWTPIGDVTTTMLWINGNISAMETIKSLFLPSLASLAVSLAVLTPSVEASSSHAAIETKEKESALSIDAQQKRDIVFWGGIGALIAVPIFKATTGLPPYMGMLCALGMLWIVADYINREEGESCEHLLPESALSRIDTSSILFFIGILLSVGAMESSGLLRALAETMDRVLPNLDFVAVAIGVSSAVIDNVPLVAATMGMYDIRSFPIDSGLWQLIAFCAGTGGSILVIGSAAGVALMGMEKTEFLWYARKISFAAAAGFFAGVGVYLIQTSGPVMNMVAQLTG